MRVAACDLGAAPHPTLVLVGDDGISLAHTCALYESLPGVGRSPRRSGGVGVK
jgi:hypothetical protein